MERVLDEQLRKCLATYLRCGGRFGVFRAVSRVTPFRCIHELADILGNWNSALYFFLAMSEYIEFPWGEIMRAEEFVRTFSGAMDDAKRFWEECRKKRLEKMLEG